MSLDSFSSDVLSIERDGPVATLWLDRPERRNAFGTAIWDDLPRAMAAVEGDAEVRVVVLAARGDAFTVGLDLREMQHVLAPSPGMSGAADRRRLLGEVRRLQGAINAVADASLPVVAAIHGWCIGAGVDLATACDVRLAAADAVFSVRETRMAIVADLGTLQRLPRILNPGHVAELVYTGDDVDAERALAMGLVTGVYDDAGAVLAAARAMAARMARNSPLVVQGAKAVLRHAAEHPTSDSLEYVALWNAAFLQSDDLGEALRAFAEKRPARFEGR